MTNVNPLNIYRGHDALKKYFDPNCAPPLPLVELPSYLNPFFDDGVRIYAKMMTMHPANNVKAMAALKLLSPDVLPAGTKTICEYSSGSTVISMSLVARVYHRLEDTRAFLSNKTSQAKLKLMQFFGLNLTLFGGPSQPEPTDARGGIKYAQQIALESEGVINPNQYTNDLNWQAHIAWTGPQIFAQLPEITLMCAGIGTTGTITGLGTYFKQTKPSVYRLGVCTKEGERVPGPRSYSLLAPVEFPWQEAVDEIQLVGAHDSYTLSLKLSRNGIICGPSSGFSLQGLFQLLQTRKKAGTLTDLRAPDGLVHAVFMCCDLPYQYIDDYFDKLGPSSFPPITNQSLTRVDLYRYHESWELNPELAPTAMLDAQILDFRAAKDFEQQHMDGAIHVPLESLSETTISPFSDYSVLECQWKELEAIFGRDEWREKLRNDKLMCLCYQGDTSRVATSVLRAKGFEANSIKGGISALNDVKIMGSGLGCEETT